MRLPEFNIETHLWVGGTKGGLDEGGENRMTAEHFMKAAVQFAICIFVLYFLFVILNTDYKIQIVFCNLYLVSCILYVIFSF